MAESRAELGSLDAGGARGGGMIEPSIWNALLYFQPLAVFPLIALGAMYGGWWLAGPIVFIVLVESLDGAFGQEERNMDPDKTPESRLFWYELTLWLWAILWPLTFVFALWQILVAGHLAVWEVVLMVVVLVNVAQAVFIIGHELIHRPAAWERCVGEFLLASASYPHYATEHIYVHHALACTPMDSGTAPKGVSFWQHIPGDLKYSLIKAWRFACNRLARRHLPVWHYTNPFWRYILETAAWYALVYWMGGPWALLVFVALCFSVILSMKIINYAQHYGLQRIRLPGGRYEKVQPRHSWSASSRFTNWLFYNMQRHPDHHIEATRHYPLLQHYGEDEAPKLPGSYLQMAGLAMFPRRWFQAMDPLVDRWRAKFYPQIDDWRAYESRAYAVYPDTFEVISEILDTAPRLAEWINHSPELLEDLQDKEFTDLDIPGGFGPDSEFESIARRGLARLYWTRELDVYEMKERIAETPVLGARESAEVTRNWSNDKVFQIGVHTMRSNLLPSEAGVALSNICEASVAVQLSAAEAAYASRRAQRGDGGVVAMVLGEPASAEMTPGAEIDLVFVYDGGPSNYYEGLCASFLEQIHTLLHNNLLFAPVPYARAGEVIRSLSGFEEHYRTVGSARDLLDLTRARCIFESGDLSIKGRLDEARQNLLAHGATRDALIAQLREPIGNMVKPDLSSVDDMRGGYKDVERAARFLQLTHAGDLPEILAPDAVSVFRTAGERELIPSGAAERLVEASKMWQNLRGALRWLAEDGFDIETASPSTKAVIARSCEVEDFDALTAAICEMASRAAADIDALTA